MPNEINLMEHCLIVEQTAIECNIFFFLQTLLLSCYPMPLLLLLLTAMCSGSFLLNTVERNQKKKKKKGVGRQGNQSLRE